MPLSAHFILPEKKRVDAIDSGQGEYQGKNAIALLEFESDTKDPFLKRVHCASFLDMYLSAVEREEGKIENVYSQ